MEFHKKRRQQFLTEIAYNGTKRSFEEDGAPLYLRSLSRPDFDAMDRTRNADAYADESFTTYMLRYTAGASLDSLREDLDHIIFAFEQAARFKQTYAKSPTFPPLLFIEIDEYERVLQMIGLCFLLHRRDLLSRVAAIFDPSSAARDALYEDMLSFELEGRFDIEKWYHESYRDLINSMYRDTEQEIVSDFELYIKNWYKSLAKAPWHDSHLQIEDDMCAGYFGYWAIEAAALAYLMEVDDTSFREHLVYPKDLVDYANAMDESMATSANKQSQVPLRVEGGKPCPAAGYWMTPAWLDSRRFFTTGEIMPIYSQSPCGATIWQWSGAQ